MSQQIKYALRWCRACRNPVATGSRCRCPQAYDHVPVMIKDCLVGQRAQFGAFAHCYGCVIGEGAGIGAFVEVQRGVVIGPRCKIGSHSFLCTGVTIEEGAFIGHGVMFCNDRRPRAIHPDGVIVADGDWTLEQVVVRRGASIGSGAIILPGLTIGADSMIGAGTIVTRDVAPNSVVRMDVAYVVRERAS